MRGFVVVEGLIGVGKTSLCRLLEARWGARLVLEPNETNPFLELFYSDPVRYGMPVQLMYLLQRWRQQDQVRQGDLFGPLVVSDYCFAKDRMFAEKTLADDELHIYDQVARSLGEKAPRPDLLVYLSAPISVVLSRIAQRQAPGEKAITAAYLEDLAERYERMLDRWTSCPVLRIENTNIDSTVAGAQQDALVDRVAAALRGATTAQPAPSPPGQLGLFGS